MTRCRKFPGVPVTRLIVTVPVDVVYLMNWIAQRPHHADDNQAEFIRITTARNWAAT